MVFCIWCSCVAFKMEGLSTETEKPISLIIWRAEDYNLKWKFKHYADEISWVNLLWFDAASYDLPIIFNLEVVFSTYITIIWEYHFLLCDIGWFPEWKYLKCSDRVSLFFGTVTFRQNLWNQLQSSSAILLNLVPSLDLSPSWILHFLLVTWRPKRHPAYL